MLYWLIEFADKISFLNVFRYITFRTGGATMTALIFVFVAGSPIIDLLRLKQGRGQPIRDDGPQSHRTAKIGTPRPRRSKRTTSRLQRRPIGAPSRPTPQTPTPT
jgi:phospho-N-acetylmuramoyl-pentapeptide-transferase